MNENLVEAWERLRRRIRKATRFSRWSLHSKVAVAAWMPVALVAFILYTGPYQPSAAHTAPAAPAKRFTYPPAAAFTPPADSNAMLSAALNSNPPKKNIPTTTQFRVIVDLLRADHYARLRDAEPLLRAKARTRAANARIHTAQTRKTVQLKTALQHQVQPGHPSKR